MLCLILSVVVLMIDIDLVGMLWVWGLELNSITTINLVMAVGLVRVFVCECVCVLAVCV